MTRTTIFQFFLNCWEQRKHDLHGDPDDENNIDLMDLREQPLYISKQELQVAKWDEHFTNTSEEDMLQMNSNSLRAWIFNARKTLSIAFQRQFAISNKLLSASGSN